MTPLTLGIETLGGIMTPLIERNTTIPSKKSEIFSTASENQPSVEIKVLQGDRKMAGDNKRIGVFHLDGLPPAPRGVPQIEVTFDIDANGILNVTAKDLGTGKEQKIVITASSGLDKSEIEKMRRDAEEHAADDAKRREEVEARNMAENLVYQSEKVMKESGEKIPAANRQAVEKAATDLKDALKSNDAERIKSGQQALNDALQAASQELYKNVGHNAQQQPPPAGEASSAGADAGAGAPPPPSDKKEDGVIDADYTMVDEEKKRKK